MPGRRGRAVRKQRAAPADLVATLRTVEVASLVAATTQAAPPLQRAPASLPAHRHLPRAPKVDRSARNFFESVSMTVMSQDHDRIRESIAIDRTNPGPAPRGGNGANLGDRVVQSHSGGSAAVLQSAGSVYQPLLFPLLLAAALFTISLNPRIQESEVLTWSFWGAALFIVAL